MLCRLAYIHVGLIRTIVHAWATHQCLDTLPLLRKTNNVLHQNVSSNTLLRPKCMLCSWLQSKCKMKACWTKLKWFRRVETWPRIERIAFLSLEGREKRLTQNWEEVYTFIMHDTELKLKWLAISTLHNAPPLLTTYAHQAKERKGAARWQAFILGAMLIDYAS